jgi:hypothetical protein
VLCARSPFATGPASHEPQIFEELQQLTRTTRPAGSAPAHRHAHADGLPISWDVRCQRRVESRHRGETVSPRSSKACPSERLAAMHSTGPLSTKVVGFHIRRANQWVAAAQKSLAMLCRMPVYAGRRSTVTGPLS